MRIPSGKIDQYIYFVAVDINDHVTRKTGLSSFTVYRSRNNGTATLYTTPTVAQLDATNMPGVYSLLIDEDTTIAAASDSEEYVVHITQASMAPVTRTVELYRRPDNMTLTESYAADGAAPTVGQALMLIQQALTEFAVSGTALTIKKLDGSTTAAVLTLDSATAPTSATRTT